jgi:hypothetical protein
LRNDERKAQLEHVPREGDAVEISGHMDPDSHSPALGKCFGSCLIGFFPLELGRDDIRERRPGLSHYRKKRMTVIIVELQERKRDKVNVEPVFD